MSIKERLLAARDHGLAALFEKVEPDTKRLANKAVSSINKTLAAFEANKPSRNRWEINNGVIRYRLVIEEHPVMFGDKPYFDLTPDQFAPFLRDLAASFEAGEWADELKVHGTQPINFPAGVEKKVRKARGPLSPEKLQARRDKVAAKAAATTATAVAEPKKPLRKPKPTAA